LRYDIKPYQVKTFANFLVTVLLVSLIFIDIMVFLFFSIYPASESPYFVENDEAPDETTEYYKYYTENEDGIKGYDFSSFTIEYKQSLRTNLLGILFVFTLLIPLIASKIILSHPVNKSQKVQIKMLGRLPETINFMSMSMYLKPTLNTAIEFASDNVEEPLATDLRRILWNVYIRLFDSIEESLQNFAHFWGEVSPAFERALNTIKNAVIEKTKEGIHRTLDTANDIVLEGTRRKMESFANSLKGPTMILFSMGIILPIIIGTMLPLLQSGFSTDPSGGAEGEQVVPSFFTWFLNEYGEEFLFILMDLIFPLITLVYASKILGKSLCES